MPIPDSQSAMLPVRHLSITDFHSWAFSDLLSNSLRGVLAEYIVALACGVTDKMRLEWDAKDVVTKSGIRVEVKSAAYLQSWKQNRLSTIRFDIAPKQGWDAETNAWLDSRGRSADVYVFCLLHEQDKSKVDPLDLEQWRFNVVSTEVLNQRFGLQKMVGLATLNNLQRDWIGFDALAASIERASESIDDRMIDER